MQLVVSQCCHTIMTTDTVRNTSAITRSVNDLLGRTLINIPADIKVTTDVYTTLTEFVRNNSLINIALCQFMSCVKINPNTIQIFLFNTLYC